MQKKCHDSGDSRNLVSHAQSEYQMLLEYSTIAHDSHKQTERKSTSSDEKTAQCINCKLNLEKLKMANYLTF